MSATLLLIVALVSLTAIVATVIAVARDGYRPVRTDRSRIPARVERRPGDYRTSADLDADEEAAVRAAEKTIARAPFADVAAEIAAATARPYSSAVPAQPVPARPDAARPVPAQSVPAQPDAARPDAARPQPKADPVPAQPEPAHTAVRRGGRARGPRRAASAPKSPR
jgi:HAE1 family hydrophobic/amphiphilic exporter-1